MTAEPYTPYELPGVIESMKDACALARIGPWEIDRLLRIKDLFGEEVPRLLATVEAMAADAERWQYARDNHLRAHSPHMNGTWGYAFRGMLNGLHRTPDDAIDAARKDRP